MSRLTEISEIRLLFGSWGLSISANGTFVTVVKSNFELPDEVVG